MIYVKMVNIAQSFNLKLDTINKRDNQKLLNNFFPQNLPETFKFFEKTNHIYCKLSRQWNLNIYSKSRTRQVKRNWSFIYALFTSATASHPVYETCIFLVSLSEFSALFLLSVTTRPSKSSNRTVSHNERGGTLFFFLCVLISADGRKRDCLEFVCKFVYKIHEQHHHAQQFALLHRESHRCFGSSCICGQCASFGGNLEEHYPSSNKLLHFDCRTGLNWFEQWIIGPANLCFDWFIPPNQIWAAASHNDGDCWWFFDLYYIPYIIDLNTLGLWAMATYELPTNFDNSSESRHYFCYSDTRFHTRNCVSNSQYHQGATWIYCKRYFLNITVVLPHLNFCVLHRRFSNNSTP